MTNPYHEWTEKSIENITRDILLIVSQFSMKNDSWQDDEIEIPYPKMPWPDKPRTIKYSFMWNHEIIPVERFACIADPILSIGSSTPSSALKMSLRRLLKEFGYHCYAAEKRRRRESRMHNYFHGIAKP